MKTPHLIPYEKGKIRRYFLRKVISAKKKSGLLHPLVSLIPFAKNLPSIESNTEPVIEEEDLQNPGSTMV